MRVRRFELILHRYGHQYVLPGVRLFNGWCIVDGWLPFASVEQVLEVMATEPGEHILWI